MKPLNIGVIGCGRVVREVHLRVLHTLPQAQIVALAESDETSLQEARKLSPDAKPYATSSDLLNDENVQAVVVATPNVSHASLAIEAFGRGLHVYLEKPIALDLAEAQNVVAAWQAAETVGAIGFNYRFNPLLQSAAQFLSSGIIGKIVGIRSSFCTPAKDLPIWKTARQSGGGVLLDLASHHIDTLQTLIPQKVVSAWAQIRSMQYEDDTATTELQIKDGTLVQGFFSQSAVERDLWEIEGARRRIGNRRADATCSARRSPIEYSISSQLPAAQTA
jgi:predicted dehydrogenase